MGSREETKAVKCEEVIRSITNRPSPTRGSTAALRGTVSGRAAQFSRYVLDTVGLKVFNN